VSKLIRAPLNPPEHIFKLLGLQDVQCLSKPRQLLWIGLLSSFTQVMLIVRYEFFNFVLGVSLVLAIVLRATRCKCEQCVDHHIPSILCFNAIWEQSFLPLDQVLANHLSQALVRLLPKTLHHVAQLQSTACADLLHRDLHQHCIETAYCSLGF